MAVGKEVVRKATFGAAVIIDDELIHEDDISDLCNSSNTKTSTENRRSIRSTVQGEKELDRFHKMLRQSDEAQQAVDLRRLALNGYQLKMEDLCRQTDREGQRGVLEEG